MRALLLAAICIAVLGACASTGPAQRMKLSKTELTKIGPELKDHRRCVFKKVKGYLGGSASVNFMVETAIKNCRYKLVAVSDGLDQFNLKPASKTSYLKAVERSTRNKVNEAILKATANAARKRNQARQTGTMQL